VFGLRIVDRRSPFSPDRTHVHHFLLDLGFSHRQVTMLCVSTNILLIALAVLLRNLGTTMLLGILLSISFTLISVIYYKRNKIKYPAKAKLQVEEKIIKSRKILTLAPETVELD
jgi:hypothetical protein